VIILHKGQVEHAALAPKYLGQKFAIAKILRSHRLANLINGIVPFEFKNPADWEKLEQGDVLNIEGLRAAIKITFQ
jgi:aconitate hydratase